MAFDARPTLVRYRRMRALQGIIRFVAKIGVDNGPSRRLFEALGFQETHYSKVFREHVYECNVDDVSGGASLGSGQQMQYQALSI